MFKDFLRDGYGMDGYVLSALKTLTACNRLCVMLAQAALSDKAIPNGTKSVCMYVCMHVYVLLIYLYCLHMCTHVHI